MEKIIIEERKKDQELFETKGECMPDSILRFQVYDIISDEKTLYTEYYITVSQLETLLKKGSR